jgi:glycosyltransferase involved in cell wall biosynthesis
MLKKKYKGLVFISDWNDWWGRGGLINEQRPFWYRPLFGPLETFFEENFRKRADGVTVIARALAQRAKKLGVAEDKLKWIPQGVDTDYFRPVSQQKARETVGIPKNCNIAVFSALVIIDLDLVMKAFIKVSKAIPKARLMLLGRKSPFTKKIAERYQIADKIFDLGMIPFVDYPKYLSCADVFLLPFKNKIANIGRWPTKLGEYLSIGRPVVSNPVGDIKTLFEKENLGLLAKEEHDDFADKIIQLFKNKELCEELGRNGRRFAQNSLAWPILTNKLESFYTELI